VGLSAGTNAEPVQNRADRSSTEPLYFTCSKSGQLLEKKVIAPSARQQKLSIGRARLVRELKYFALSLKLFENFSLILELHETNEF